MHNEPTIIGCKDYHHLPPVCGFAMWGAIAGLVTNQQDLLAFLNESYRREDEDFLTPVKSILNTPPGAPSDGDRYIVGCSPTGDWVGQEGNIAEWKGTYFWGGAKPAGTWGAGACGDFVYSDDAGFDSSWEDPDQWAFTTPREGSTVWVESEGQHFTFDGPTSSTFTRAAGTEAFWVPNHLLDTAKDIFPIQVLDRATTPPVSPALFDAYLVTATATGDWATHEDEIAISVCDATSGNRVWVYIQPQEGQIVWPTDEAEAYVYDGTQWITHAVHIANNHDFTDIRDVTITTPSDEDFVIYDNATGEWVNVTNEDVADILGPLINLGELKDVTITSVAQYNVIWWDGVAWVNVTPATLAGQMLFNDLGDVDTSGVVQYNTVWFDGANWVDVTPCTFLGQASISCLSDVGDLTVPTNGHVLFGNGTSWNNARLDCDDVDNASGVTGSTVCDALDNLDGRVSTNTTNITNLTTTVNNIGSDEVTNDSGVSGATVTAALNTLNGAMSAGGVIAAGTVTEDGTTTSGYGFSAAQAATDIVVTLSSSFSGFGLMYYRVYTSGGALDSEGWVESAVNAFPTTVSTFTFPGGGGGRESMFYVIGATA